MCAMRCIGSFSPLSCSVADGNRKISKAAKAASAGPAQLQGDESSVAVFAPTMYKGTGISLSTQGTNNMERDRHGSGTAAIRRAHMPGPLCVLFALELRAGSRAGLRLRFGLTWLHRAVRPHGRGSGNGAVRQLALRPARGGAVVALSLGAHLS